MSAGAVCCAGLSVFGLSGLLHERDVIIWSDNTGAEYATKKGSTKQFDQNCLIHAIWKFIATLGVEVWVARVPTDDNISDLPSRSAPVVVVCVWHVRMSWPWGREKYEMMHQLGAQRMEPVFDPLFLEAQAWESLSVLGLMR